MLCQSGRQNSAKPPAEPAFAGTRTALYVTATNGVLYQFG
jgi:hypothetical protein